MKTKQILSSFLIVVALVACNKENNDSPNIPVITDKEKSLVVTSNSFALDLFKSFSELHGDSNLFVSPISVSQALSMTYNGASGITKTAFENTLRFNDFTQQEINEFNQKMIQLITASDSKVTMNVANSIWYKNTFSVLDSFKNINTNYYNAEVISADFTSDATLKAINDWCSNKTNGKIPKIIESISPLAIMYLINAIYFKGTWAYEFEKSKTKDTLFYLENGSTSIHKQMQQESEFNYFNNDLLSMVELPYGNGNFSMFVLLPNSGVTTTDVVADLTDANLVSWMGSMKKEKVVVKLPKFKMEWGRDIKKELISMGLGNAFSDEADFSKINAQIPLSISKVIHKTYVDVNEEGTEAAAVTAVEILETSVDPSDMPKYFIANKPFLFFIKEKTSGSILFIGKLSQPN